MRNDMGTRGLVFGIILLFVGACFTPIISGNVMNQSERANDIYTKPKSKGIIYVDDDSECPGDGSWNWPYCKIQYAIDNASAGDEIHVCNGTYQSKGPVCRIDKSLTIYAGGDDPHAGDTQYPPIINASFYNNTILVTANNVTITGFNITGSGKENGTSAEGNLFYLYTGVRFAEGITNCALSHNIIQHNGAGVRAYSYTTISNNTIRDNLDDGIKTYGAIIKDNYIAHNGRKEQVNPPSKRNQGDGIEIYSKSGVSIINNTIIGNQMDGIWDDTGDRHTITGNVIKNNGQCGINFKEARGCNIKNNIIMSNTKYGIFMDISTSNTIANNTLSNNPIDIWFNASSSNSIENNMISNNTNMGIYLAGSSNNEIINNCIWYNDLGIVDIKSSNNYIYHNDFKENNISIELILSNMDFIVFNNIVTTSKMKIRAVLSIALAPMNWWGDWRGPWFNMIRIGFVIVFPWLPIPVPIQCQSYIKNSHPK